MKITLECRHCKNKYTRMHSKAIGSKYCSRICQNTYQARMPKKFSSSHGKWNIGRVRLDVVERNRSRVGIKASEETKDKMSFAHRGERNINWAGGISFNKYPRQFSRGLKLYIRSRDGFACVNCRRKETEEKRDIGRALTVHHIDYYKDNCCPSNLVTLCNLCNLLANKNRDFWTFYYSYASYCYSLHTEEVGT